MRGAKSTFLSLCFRYSLFLLFGISRNNAAWGQYLISTKVDFFLLGAKFPELCRKKSRIQKKPKRSPYPFPERIGSSLSFVSWIGDAGRANTSSASSETILNNSGWREIRHRLCHYRSPLRPPRPVHNSARIRQRENTRQPRRHGRSAVLVPRWRSCPRI